MPIILTNDCRVKQVSPEKYRAHNFTGERDSQGEIPRMRTFTQEGLRRLAAIPKISAPAEASAPMRHRVNGNEERLQGFSGDVRLSEKDNDELVISFLLLPNNASHLALLAALDEQEDGALTTEQIAESGVLPAYQIDDIKRCLQNEHLILYTRKTKTCVLSTNGRRLLRLARARQQLEREKRERITAKEAQRNTWGEERIAAAAEAELQRAHIDDPSMLPCVREEIERVLHDCNGSSNPASVERAISAAVAVLLRDVTPVVSATEAEPTEDDLSDVKLAT
jgi:hypothetical protein